MVFRTSATRVCSCFRYARELVAGQIGVVPALLLQHFGPGRRFHHGFDRLDERVALRRRDAGGAHHGAPVGDVEVDALLLQRRGVDALDALRRGHREDAQLAGLDLAFELAVARDAGRDLAAHDRGDRLAAAGERDVVDLGRIAADRLGEEPDRDVIDAARGAAGPGDLPGLRLEPVGEVLRGLERRVRRHDDDEVLAREPRDRRHLVEGDRRLVGQDRSDHDEAVHHQLVAVALGAVHELGDADGAAGARDVRHLHALCGAGLNQRLLHRARGLVPAAAGRRRSQDLELHLRRRGAAQAEKRGRGEKRAAKAGR